MKKRCGHHPNYIEVSYCDEWKDFDNFYKWAIKNNYLESLTLDRIDFKGNYSPENCRWVTHKKQARNTSRNRMITYKGMTKCVNEWAEYYDINTKTLLHRLNHGWSLEKAFNTEAGKYEK
jgi:hypothetical protein